MIDDDHSARSIREMIGGLDLSLYIAKIAAVEGRAGRDHTAPQLLISLWLYAYSRGISGFVAGQVPGRFAWNLPRAMHRPDCHRSEAPPSCQDASTVHTLLSRSGGAGRC